MSFDTFRQRFEPLVGRDRVDEMLEETILPCVRVNTTRTTPAEARADLEALGYELGEVPWCDHAFLLTREPEDLNLGNTWEHQAGYLYSQHASSLLPSLALDPSPGEVVFDLCAAPGSKTTHLTQLMENRGLILAADKVPGRLNNLISNLDRVGTLPVAALRADMRARTAPFQADGVVVDAPCSNLGAACYDKKSLARFKVKIAEGNAGLQRKLLLAGFWNAKVGSRIVYSTCTLDPLENEGVATWFLETFPVRVVRPDLGGLDGARGVEEDALADIAPEVAEASIRLWPGDHGTEGFYCIVFAKLDAFDEAPQALRPTHTLKGRAPTMDPAPELLDELGTDHPILKHAMTYRRGDRILLATVPEDLRDEVLAIGPDRVGIDVGAVTPHGVRLTFEGATLLGSHARRTQDVTPAQARQFMAGKDVPWEGELPWTVFQCEGRSIGCARTWGDVVQPFVPKQRRVPLDTGAAGWLTRAEAR